MSYVVKRGPFYLRHPRAYSPAWGGSVEGWHGDRKRALVFETYWAALWQAIRHLAWVHRV